MYSQNIRSSLLNFQNRFALEAYDWSFWSRPRALIFIFKVIPFIYWSGMGHVLIVLRCETLFVSSGFAMVKLIVFSCTRLRSVLSLRGQL